MARARHSDAAVQVTVPGVIEAGAELVVKNESDQPVRVVTDAHERLKGARTALMSQLIRHRELPVDP